MPRPGDGLALLEADPPLNVLIDADGRIATIARGTSPQTIERIAEQARKLLDELGPAMIRGLRVRSPIDSIFPGESPMSMVIWFKRQDDPAGADDDRLYIFQEAEFLDGLADEMGVRKISSFFDYTDVNANLAEEELGDDGAGTRGMA